MEAATCDGIIRPLIGISRGEVRDHLTAIGEPYREDETNLETNRMRNRIRLEVLPVLEAAARGATATLASTAEILAAEDAYLDSRAEALLPEDGLGVPVDLLREAPRALARRLIRLAAARGRDRSLVLERVHVEAILDLVEGDSTGRSLNLPAGHRVERRGNRVVFT